jgi:putative sigma-54 modulation protein
MRMIVSLLRVSFQILARLGFMKITITSHHVSVSDSLKEFAEERMQKLNRYFDNILEVHVDLKVETVSNSNEQQVASATIHLPGSTIHADDCSSSMYASLDGLVSKLQRQLKKHKQKLRDNNRGTIKSGGGSSLPKINRHERKFIPKPMEVEVAAQICKDEGLGVLVFRNIENESICVLHELTTGELELIET